MSKQKYGKTRRSLFEMKQSFIVGLSLVSENSQLGHTIITENDPNGEQTFSFAAIVIGWATEGAELNSVMGAQAFYEWLDRFLRATPDERGAMWENEGEW